MPQKYAKCRLICFFEVVVVFTVGRKVHNETNAA